MLQASFRIFKGRENKGVKGSRRLRQFKSHLLRHLVSVFCKVNVKFLPRIGVTVGRHEMSVGRTSYCNLFLAKYILESLY